MSMKRFGFLIVAVIGFSLVIASCKSTDVENRPLWTDASTIAQVFSPEEYVTGIGRAVTADVAVNLADGNLAAYFSREIISVTSAQTNISSSDTGHGDESLLRDVTVVSESVLDVVLIVRSCDEAISSLKPFWSIATDLTNCLFIYSS